MLRLNGVPGSSPCGSGASVVPPQPWQCPAPAFAGAGSAFHPCDHRLDLRQVDLVVAGRQRVVVLVQRGLAVCTANRTRDHGLVGVCHQRSPAAFAPQAALARTFTLGLVRAVGLLALRGWHGGVVRRLRRPTEPGLQFRHPRRQCLDLRRERLNLRPERSDQRVLLVVRQVAEVGKIGHPKLESWAPWSRQLSIDPIAYQPSSRGVEQIRSET